MEINIPQLITQYSQDLSRLCRSLCKTQQDAEDLFQTTWEKVLRHKSKYDPLKPFDKWLWSVCVNAYRDMMRNPFRRRVLKFSDTEELEYILNSVPCTDYSRDEYIALHCAINKLPPYKRQAVALYYFKDYSIAEVAEILSIPGGTVKSRLSSAREFIRKEIGDE